MVSNPGTTGTRTVFGVSDGQLPKIDEQSKFEGPNETFTSLPLIPAKWPSPIDEVAFKVGSAAPDSLSYKAPLPELGESDMVRPASFSLLRSKANTNK
jgi:hypothetical protein